MKQKNSKDMQCEEIAHLLNEYISGNLGEAQAKKVKEHLSKCEKCRELVYSGKEEQSGKCGTPDGPHGKITDGIEESTQNQKPEKHRKGIILTVIAAILLICILCVGILNKMFLPSGQSETGTVIWNVKQSDKPSDLSDMFPGENGNSESAADKHDKTEKQPETTAVVTEKVPETSADTYPAVEGTGNSHGILKSGINICRTWTVTTSNNKVISLTLLDDGHFRYRTPNNSLKGTYSIENDIITLRYGFIFRSEYKVEATDKNMYMKYISGKRLF